jgi:3-oxoacyl-[acyl-carrier-protein] synthase-3
MAISQSIGINVKGIISLVPKNVEDNESLDILTESEREALIKHTGIRFRRVNPNNDIGVKDYFNAGVEKLLKKLNWDKESIDILICVTQTPKIAIPSVACQIHGDLEFESQTMCYDINSGCSGFVYGLHTVSQLLAGINKPEARAILCSGDISTSLIDPLDRSVRPIFSDAVSVIGIENTDDESITGYFNLETMGKGQHAIRTEPEANGDSFMRLNGIDVFNYSVSYVPVNIQKLIETSGKSMNDMDTFVFHQANKLINDSIAKKAGLEPIKVMSSLYEYGNTASASIPVTLGLNWSKIERKSNWILISGFGVGFSIASAMIHFNPEICEPPEEIELN